MKTNKLILQKLKSTSEDEFGKAEKYYNVLSVLNNLKLTERELQLVAFTAVRGNMSNANVRNDFCTRYGTSTYTINNIISKLKKIHVFIKDGNKVKVNPVIALDFNKDVKLEIELNSNEQAS